MSIVTNTFLTYSAKGLREQLSNIIYNISPEDTPLVSMMGKEGADGVLMEWQTDALGAVDTTNKQLEGDDIASFPAIVASARVGNYQQISRKLILLSDTEEVVDKAGRKSEMAYQVAMRGAELKRDVEAIVFCAQAGNAGASGTARATATLNAWVKTNVDKDAGGTDPSYTAGVPNAARGDGTNRLFTVTILKSVVQKIWTSGGTPKYLFVGPVNKARVSGFTGIATATNMVNNGKSPMSIVGAADVFVSDFGNIQVIADRWQRERDGWFIDPEYLAIQSLRPFKTVDLAKTGDATKKMLLTEWGLKVKQEAALGLAADLQTT